MLIALAFAHFSSELLLKEQMIIPVKKTLNNAGHIDAKLIDFSEICQKKSSEIGCFLLIVSWRSFPPKFPAKSAAFSANFDFSPAKIPRNRPIFPRICPWKSRKILLFFPRNIRSPVHSINHHPADKVQGNQLQHAKKVVSDGQGLMDFAIWLVNSVLDLPDERVMFFEEFK